MYHVSSIKGSKPKKSHNTYYLIHTTEKGFSPLLFLLPIALFFMVTVFLLQTILGKSIRETPDPTPQVDIIQAPEEDPEACNDKYNADCYIGDDEADQINPQDLIGPD